MANDSHDPILQRRETIRGQAQTGQRIGYALYGVAMVLFFIGLATRYSNPLVWTIVALLIAGSIILAIAIQVGYAIKGAERHEEDSAAMRRRR